MGWSGGGRGGGSRGGWGGGVLPNPNPGGLHVSIFGLREIVPGGIIRTSNKTTYNSSTQGFYLGIPEEDGAAVFGLGDGSNYLTWDGTTLTIAGEGSGLTEIDGGNIQTGTVTADAIAAGTITATEIAAGTITATEIAAGTITATEIAADAITATHIAAGAVDTAELAAGAVTAAKIAAGTITATEIAADAITATHIAAGAVDTAELAAQAVTAAKIAAGTITATEIAAGTITATELATETITAAQIEVGTLTFDRLVTGFQSDNLIQDASFESGSLSTVHDFSDNGGATTGWDAVTNIVRSGSYAVRFIPDGQTSTADAYLNGDPTAAGFLNRHVAAMEGREYTFEVYAYRTFADTNTVRLYTRWYDASGALLTSNYNSFDPATWTATEWTLLSSTKTAPAGAAYVVWGLSVLNSGNSGNLFFDDVVVRATIGASLIQAAAITTDKLAAGAVTATEIAAGTITSTEIAADAITATHIAAGAVDTAELAAGAVTAAKIAAGTITATEIAAGTITATEIAAGTITATEIAAGTITATELATETITAAHIEVGTLTFDRLVTGFQSDNLIQDASFESGSLSTVHDFSDNGGATTGWDAVTNIVRSGSYAVRFIPDGQTSTADAYLNGDPTAAGFLNRHVAAMEGREYTFEVYAYRTFADTNTVRLYTRWYDASGALLTSNYNSFDPATWTATEWTLLSSTKTAPAGAAYVVWGLSVLNSGNSGNLFFDDVVVRATIGASLIQAAAITTDKLAAGAVTATEINVSSLSAIAADLGTITAGSIVVGSTNVIWLNDGSDGQLAIGGTTKASAPFRVSAAGDLTAESATIAGDITAESGEITGTLDIDTDTGQIRGLEGGEEQWYLDRYGLFIISRDEEPNRIHFYDENGLDLGWLRAEYDSSTPATWVSLAVQPNVNTYDTYLSLRASADPFLSTNLYLYSDYNGSGSALLSFVSTDTNVPATIRLTHNTTSTPANGLGVELQFQAETSTTPTIDLARIAATWSDVTHASRAGQLSFYVDDSSGESEVLRLEADATTLFQDTTLSSAQLSITGTLDDYLLNASGTTTSNLGLNLSPTIQTSSNPQGIRAVPVVEPGGSLTHIYSINANLRVGGSSSHNVTNLYSLFARVQPQDSYGGTIANVYGVYVDSITNSSSGSPTVTNSTGIFVKKDAFPSNQYGFRTNINSGYGLYIEGNADNYIKGNLGLNVTSPTALLHLGLGTEELEVVDAGSTGATEQDWIEVQVGGNTGYIRVYATK